MVYQCEQNGGGLIAAYPDQITQDECKMMVELMELNPDGILMAGLPEDVPIAHKHGWAESDTILDSAIVYSPGRDYVIASIAWGDVSWLEPRIAFPVIQDISSMTLNHFNPDLISAPRRGYNPDLNLDLP
jgi:hypothetical protein